MTERYMQLHSLLSSALRAGTGYSNPINASEYKEAIFFLDVTTNEGTNPTLDLTLQLSPDNPTADNWFDTASTFTQSVAAVKRLLTIASGLGMYVRFKYVIGGTNTPKFTFSLKGAFKS